MYIRTAGTVVIVGLMICLSGCLVPVPVPVPVGTVIVGHDGYRHEGYYDHDRRWHGGYYDERHYYHDDRDDWHDRRR